MGGAPVKVWAPGKINLCFDVLYRRHDGYHAVDGVMHSIALSDTLEVRRSTALTLEVGWAGGESGGRPGAAVPPGDDNLVMKAARRLQEVSGFRGGAAIRLTKAIPAAAGLGGGSTDAGACLTALNEFWDLGLTYDELHDIAVPLGADVPFTLRGGAARARGIGEQLTPLPPMAGVPVVLIPQPFPLSTPKMFQAFSVQSFPGSGEDEGAEGVAGAAPAGPSHHPAVPVSAMVEAVKEGRVGEAARLCMNRLQPMAASMYPDIGEAVDDLRRYGALGAAMTGAGPTVFGIFAGPEEAAEALTRLKARWPLALQTSLSAGLGWGRSGGGREYSKGALGGGEFQQSTGGGAAPKCQ